MLKRQILLGLIKYATGIAVENNAYSDAWGCAKCLRNEFTYIMPGRDLREIVSDSSKYTGSCCLSDSDTTFCAKHFINGVIERDSVVLNYQTGTNSLEVLIGHCPYNSAVCKSSGGNGEQSSEQSLVIDKIGSSEVSLTMSGAFLADKDQCSWVVKVECGAPGLKIDTSTTLDETKAILSFTDYSNQFNNVDGIILEGTKPHNVWLSKKFKSAQYDMETYNGIPGMLQFEILNPNGPENYWHQVPGWIIDQWHAWTLNNYAQYEIEKKKYEDLIDKMKKESFEEHCFLGRFCSQEHVDLILPHAPSHQHLILGYNGPDVGVQNVVSGYGKLTSGTFRKIQGDGGRSYGVNGQDDKVMEGTTISFDNTQQGIRLRKETGTVAGTGGCDDSYMMVQMIPLADSAGTLTAKITSEKWYDDLASPLNSYPELIKDQGTDLESANYLKCASIFALVLMLYI